MKNEISNLPIPIKRGIQQMVWWSITRHEKYGEKYHPTFKDVDDAISLIISEEELKASKEANLEYQKCGDHNLVAEELFDLFCFIIHQMDSGESEDQMVPRYFELKEKYPRCYDQFSVQAWG